MRRWVVAGLVLVAVAVGLYSRASLAQLERNVEIHIGGSQPVHFSDRVYVFDWRNWLLCGVATVGAGAGAKRYRFDSVDTVEPYLTEVNNKVICDMDMPWWWVRL